MITNTGLSCCFRITLKKCPHIGVFPKIPQKVYLFIENILPNHALQITGVVRKKNYKQILIKLIKDKVS